MPAKKEPLTDAERAKRIRETAREVGTDNDPASFDRAFAKEIQPPHKVGGAKRGRPLKPGE
jgi:hypothetical protein